MDNADTRVGGYRGALEVSWLAVIFLVPLFFNPLSHQAFYLNKALLLQFLVSVMLALWVADWLHSKSSHQGLKWRNILTSPLHLSILIFGLVAIVSTAVSITPAVSFWGSWGRKSGLLTLICWIVFFLIVAGRLRHRAQLFRAIYALLLSSSIVSVLGIVQYFFPDTMYRLFHCAHSGRVFSTSGNALSLSGFLAMVIPLNMALIVISWNSWFHSHPDTLFSREREPTKARTKNAGILIGLVALLALQFWCLWLAQYSLTILLFIIAPIVFIALLGIVKRKKLILSLGAMSLLILAIVAGLILVPLMSSDTSVEIPETEGLESTITTGELGVNYTMGLRVQFWRSAADIVLKSPEVPFSNDRLYSLRTLIGYGPETFIITFQNFFPEGMKNEWTQKSGLIDRPHNHYLYLAATVGLLGLAGFLSILAVFLYLCFRYLRRETWDINKLLLIALVASMAGYMADSLFNPSTISPELVFWLMLSLVPVIGRLTSSGEPTKVEITPEEVAQHRDGEISHITRTRVYLSVGCAVLLVVIGIGVTIRPFLADIYLQKGLNLQARGSEQAVFAFSKAVKIQPEEPAYWSYLGAYTYSVARRAGDKPANTEILAYSTSAYEEARELEPYIAYRYYSLADVYVYWAHEGAEDKWPTALSLYDKAAQLFPRNAVILDKWALALIIKGDFDEAREKLDYAASIDPDWPETSFLSGLLLAREAKDDEAARAIIAPIQESPGSLKGFVDFCRGLAGYNMVRPLGDALEVYTQEVSDEWIPRAMLGVTSLFVGSLDKSVDEFDTAMLLVPDEDVGDLFRAILRLSQISPGFKTMLPGVACEWRTKLAQSAERDTLLQALDELVDTSP